MNAPFKAAIVDHHDHADAYYLLSYVNGALLTMGVWGCPRDAMNRCPEAGAWIEFAPFKWQSTDGRHLIGADLSKTDRAVAA